MGVKRLKRYGFRKISKLAKRYGMELKPISPDFFLHEYSSYDEYKAVQIARNEAKLNRNYADEQTLDRVIERLNREFHDARVDFGLCHGTRNGFEQKYLASEMNVDVIGTDISPTAAQFPRSVVWDFHDVNQEWVGKCDFIYSNSLDHSWNPKLALSTWLDQLKPGGLLFLEHSRDHSAEHTSETDPFGVSLHYLLYLLCDWFGHQISTEIIHGEKGPSTTLKHIVGMPTKLLVIKKLGLSG